MHAKTVRAVRVKSVGAHAMLIHSECCLSASQLLVQCQPAGAGRHRTKGLSLHVEKEAERGFLRGEIILGAGVVRVFCSRLSTINGSRTWVILWMFGNPQG